MKFWSGMILLLLSSIVATAQIVQFSGAPIAAAICWQTDPATGWTTLCATTGTGTCNAAGTGTQTGTCYTAVSAAGNDGTCSSSTTSAGAQSASCLTLDKGLSLVRNNKPDWLLLKAGDTWTNQVLNFNTYRIGGVSATAPILISSYGTGARPLIQTSATQSAIANAGNGGGNNLAVVGIDFYSYTRDPNNGSYNSTTSAANDPNAININTLATNFFLLEDCKVSWYGVNVVFQSTAGTDTRFRRNVIVDAYSSSGAHSQGVFAENVTANGFLFEENLLDHNGWAVGITGAGATQFNHGIYLNNDDVFHGGAATFRGNIAAQSSSHGLYFRPGGTFANNFMVLNSVGGEIGYALATNNPTGTVTGSVVFNSTSNFATSLGWGINVATSTGVSLTSNIITQKIGGGSNGFSINFDNSDGSNPVNGSATNNIVFSWDKAVTDSNTGHGNVVTPNCNDLGGTNNNPGGACPAEPFTAPTVTLGSYYGSIGGSPSTTAAFLTAARLQSKSNWNCALTAQAVVNYFRNGYGLTPITKAIGCSYLLKRDLDPASNDNDPMWLQKVA